MSFSPAVPMPFAHDRYLGRPSCPRCGTSTFAAEASFYSNSGRVRHAWCCDVCEQAFETEIDLTVLVPLPDFR